MITYDVEVCSAEGAEEETMKCGLNKYEVTRLIIAMADGDALVINAKDERPSL